MFPAIRTLARRIDAAWAKAGYAEAKFAALAARHLAGPVDLDFSTLARRVSEGAALPEQRRSDQAFGQPALTLHHGDRFLIEALCWHSGTPAIHQHAFSGAFRVATGCSVHSRYSFIERERIERVSLGDLRLERVEILDKTSTVEIPRGRGLIHSTFHLDSPSMTIVVRTHQVAEPELTYLPPGVAYDTSARSSSLHKQLQLLDTLNVTGHAAYANCVRAAIDSSDLYNGMAIVMRAGSHRVDERTFLAFVARLRGRHGPRSRPLVTALIEERRRGTIVRFRAAVTDPDDRFFLASLLSFSRRTDLLDAMVQRYGNVATARRHIATGVGRLLGANRDRQIITATAAHAMLDGVPARSFPARATQGWKRALRADEAAKLRTFYEHVRGHPLLSPLVQGNGRRRS